MGIQTVIILVQFAIILLALGAAGYFWHRSQMQQQTIDQLHALLDQSRIEAQSANGMIADLNTDNEYLRRKASQIPVAPIVKKSNDGPIVAKSAAQVRGMTERIWGVRPDLPQAPKEEEN